MNLMFLLMQTMLPNATLIAEDQIRWGNTATPMIMVQQGSKITRVEIGTGLRLVSTGTGFRLETTGTSGGGGTGAPVVIEDVKLAPGPEPRQWIIPNGFLAKIVYRNGLKMTSTTSVGVGGTHWAPDYSINGNILTFTTAQVPDDQLQYADNQDTITITAIVQ